MHVQVKDFLPAIMIAVDNEPIAALCYSLLLGDFPRRQEQPSRHALIFFNEVVDGGNLFVGDDENVYGGYRVDIAESRNQIVLVDNSRRQLTADDPGKYSGQTSRSFDRAGRFY